MLLPATKKSVCCDWFFAAVSAGMLGFGTIVVVVAAAGNIVFQATVSAAKAGVPAVISDVG